MAEDVRWGLYMAITTYDPHISFQKLGRTRETIKLSMLEKRGKELIDIPDGNKWKMRTSEEAEKLAKEYDATIIAVCCDDEPRLRDKFPPRKYSYTPDTIRIEVVAAIHRRQTSNRKTSAQLLGVQGYYHFFREKST